MDRKTLYLECYSGISGDMTVAALIDLGADVDVLLNGLNSLNVDGYKVVISRKLKNSIDACDFHVILDDDIAVDDVNVDPDYVPDKKVDQKKHHVRRYLNSHSSSLVQLKKHEHSHDDGHTHSHSHDDSHSHSHGDAHIHYGHHDHRNLTDINTIIDNSQISKRAKDIAKRIFYIVAVAEAKAHGKSIDEIHFHEVGAVDSIVDIVATAICIDNLNIEDVIVTELYEGTGHIKCQHGVLPVPVPAVINISTAHQLPLHITSVKGELVTPTGAAIVAAIRTKDTLPRDFKVLKVGLGAGKRNYEQASFLRAMLIEENKQTSANTSQAKTNTTPDKVWVLEANIDDCSGEVLALAMDVLLKNGAKDVYYTPIFMKKNRPAYLLGVICKEEDIELVEEIIFTHTTTIGIRKQEATRTTLNRTFKTVSTPYGDATVKVCTYKDKIFYYPEYESIKKLCLESGIDYNTLYSYVQTLAMK
jgi:pyridinium-3,5-bisthiocarboxylic acid mononucleotide nickel chelatase